MWLYDAVKDGAKILKEAWKIEEYQKILELLDDSYTQREKIASLQEDNSKLRNQLKVKDEYSFRNNCYYHSDTWDGPFCSRCLDKNKELIRLTIAPGSDYGTCPECKSQVNHSWTERRYAPYHAQEASTNLW